MYLGRFTSVALFLTNCSRPFPESFLCTAAWKFEDHVMLVEVT